MSHHTPVPLTDPHHVREVLANELIAYGQLDGIVHLTFGMQRFDGVRSTGELQQSREIVCRLALSTSAFEALCDGLARMKLAMRVDPESRANGDGQPKAH